jgi:hypothetical protein
MPNNLETDLKDAILSLLNYCKNNNYAGHDPYDALNSQILKSLPFLDFRLFRLGLTQVMKRLPFNLRPLLLIPKTENPKAIALFLMAFLKLKKLGLLEDENLIPEMIQRLIELRSPQELVSQPAAPSSSASPPVSSDQASQPCGSEPSYWCWGYSFPWQTRALLVPRWAPNLVCTCFVANSLLDAYESHEEHRCLEMPLSASGYILNELYWEGDDGIAGFAYPTPSPRTRVHNANFLGAALLCRAFKFTGDRKFLEPALKVARYSADQQHDDGSWYYGEDTTQRWIDNFHTGYNLCALQSISEDAGTSEFESHIRRGFEFYRTRFFRDDGAPKYFCNRTYPIDIHSVAQSIITLTELKDINENASKLSEFVVLWALKNMRSQNGYFFYQQGRLFKNRISYIRWSQAWMLLALAIFVSKLYASGLKEELST